MSKEIPAYEVVKGNRVFVTNKALGAFHKVTKVIHDDEAGLITFEFPDHDIVTVLFGDEVVIK